MTETQNNQTSALTQELVSIITDRQLDDQTKVEKVKKFIQDNKNKGLDINATNVVGETPLYKAVRYGTPETVQALIAAGADVNATEVYGETPLHNAVRYGTPETVQALIDAGADVNAQDKFGYAPLHRATEWGTPETVQALIAAGADVNAKDNVGETPLYTAAYRGTPEMVQALIAAGADVNAKDNYGRTAKDILKERIARETDPKKKAEFEEALATKPNASSTLGKNSGGNLTQETPEETRPLTVPVREPR